MSDTVGVVFERKHRPYNAGDRAGFPPNEARELVEDGIARYRSGAAVPEPAGEPPSSSVPSSTHELTVPEVRAACEDASLDELGSLLDSELDHPRYEGGRSTALAALREAIEARES